MVLETLKSEALQRGLLKPEEEINLKKAFFLVRDMPYTCASSRDSEMIVHEWRGTCSGKHYLYTKWKLAYLPAKQYNKYADAWLDT